jgi:prophage maintenance system killer protein
MEGAKSRRTIERTAKKIQGHHLKFNGTRLEVENELLEKMTAQGVSEMGYVSQHKQL